MTRDARHDGAELKPAGYLFELYYGNGRWSGTMFSELDPRTLLSKPEDARNIEPLYRRAALADQWEPKP